MSLKFPFRRSQTKVGSCGKMETRRWRKGRTRKVREGEGATPKSVRWSAGCQQTQGNRQQRNAAASGEERFDFRLWNSSAEIDFEENSFGPQPRRREPAPISHRSHFQTIGDSSRRRRSKQWAGESKNLQQSEISQRKSSRHAGGHSKGLGNGRNGKADWLASSQYSHWRIAVPTDWENLAAQSSFLIFHAGHCESVRHENRAPSRGRCVAGGLFETISCCVVN